MEDIYEMQLSEKKKKKNKNGALASTLCCAMRARSDNALKFAAFKVPNSTMASPTCNPFAQKEAVQLYKSR